jgi:hypothetical protein
MDYPGKEAAAWGQQVDVATRKLRVQARAVLSDAAARGFEEVPGPTMEAIIAASTDTKVALTDANQKVYQEGIREVEKAVETDQKVAFGLAKLDYGAYKAALENELDLQKAWGDLLMTERRAALEILKSDVEKRQAAIIEERALIEHEVNYWKGLAIEAEGLALDAEVELANEKVKTATEKMKIIEWLYRIMEAEQLVIAAEYKKAAALEKVLVKEEELIEVKKTLIPLQKKKAAARLEQADAITEEAEVRKEIEELGYERIELKKAQEEAEHQIRLAEEDYEEARIEYTRADRMTELTRMTSRTTVMEYENEIRDLIIERRAALEKCERAFRHDYQHYWRKYEITNDIRYMDLGKKLFILEAQHKLQKTKDVGEGKAGHTKSTGKRCVTKISGTAMTQYVSKG